MRSALIAFYELFSYEHTIAQNFTIALQFYIRLNVSNTLKNRCSSVICFEANLVSLISRFFSENVYN